MPGNNFPKRPQDHDSWFDTGRFAIISQAKTSSASPDGSSGQQLTVAYHDGDVIDISRYNRDVGPRLLGRITLTPFERGILRDTLDYVYDMPTTTETVHYPTTVPLAIEQDATDDEIAVSIRRDEADDGYIELFDTHVELLRSVLPHLRTNVRPDTRFDEHSYEP